MKNIIIKTMQEGFDVCVRCKSSDAYMVHHFPNVKREDINANLYRIRTSHAAKINEKGEYDYLFGGNLIVGDGEWECAIKEVGAADFFGGFHGDEKLIDVKLCADGKPVALGFDDLIECDEVTFYQHSYLNRCDTPGDNTAEHIKKYRIAVDGIFIEQEVIWLQSVSLECAYLGMLPVKRKVGDFQITSKAIASDGENAGVICDVREETSKTVISELNKDTTRVTLWDEDTGFSVSVEHLLSPVMKGKDFYLKIRPWDNKYYFRCCSGTVTQKGDIWHSFTKYQFDIK